MKNGVFIAIAVILFGILGFMIGDRVQGRRLLFPNMNNRFYAPQQYPNRMWDGMRRGMRGGMMWGGYGFSRGTIQGQISKIDNNAITLVLPNGATYTVTMTDQTAVNKTVPATKSDLKAGENISVYSQPSATGGATVQSIMINP